MAEMDMKEKLVELLDDIQRCGDDYTDHEIYGMRLPDTVSNEDVADHLIANGVTFATDNNVGSKWIPVTERLPENDQWVLCFMKDKAFGTFRVFQWNYIDWQWNDGNEWYDENDVTHWMPLPEPPKGE